MIIAIDTSSTQAGIAISSDSGPLGELTWIAGRDHSTQLFQALLCLTDLTGVRVSEMTQVAVAAGPGSFSGIRVGMSAGKALAFALGIPLVAVGTLDIIAAGACASGTIWSILDAGRGDVYLASYRSSPLPRQRTSEYSVVSAADAAALIADGDHLAGEGAAMLTEPLQKAGKSATIDGVGGNLRRAVYLAELCEMYFARGGTDQSHEAEPLYLRRSAAEEKRDAAQG